jgi:DNA-binding NarL/FixJ family response regulator
MSSELYFGMRSEAVVPPTRRLSERQRSVLNLICRGFRNGEIAQQLGLSSRAIKACASEILLIFDVSNRTELGGLLGSDFAVTHACGVIKPAGLQGPSHAKASAS